MDESLAKVRLDLWLWAVRLYKTRPLARTAIERRDVTVNGQAAKPSRALKRGDIVAWERDDVRDEVRVEGVIDKRVGAPVAQTLYTRTEHGEATRAKDLERRRLIRLQNQTVAPESRPGKHAREVLRRAKRGQR